MKATGFKRIGKRFGAKLLMIVLCVAMLVSSVSAFAMPKIAKEEKMGYGDDGMGHYYSAFSSNEELKEATKEKNIEIASEGTILLKNGGGVDGTEDKLPYTDMKNISIFGINSDAFGYGGTGSGSVIDAIAQTRKWLFEHNYEEDKQYHLTVFCQLPENTPPPTWNTGRYKANGYGALLELNNLFTSL